MYLIIKTSKTEQTATTVPTEATTITTVLESGKNQQHFKDIEKNALN
jgi:hypothetical protein